MSSPLETLRELSTLHRIAVVGVLGQDMTTLRTAYESLADGLHDAMMGIACGNDPTVEIEGLQVAWLTLAEDADGQAPVLFETWAGKLATVNA